VTSRRIEPIGRPLDVVLHDVPGSKSIANRALVCATLANGASVLRGIAPGDDTAALLDCIERLGAGVELSGNHAVIAGTGGALRPGPEQLPTRLAGTTSRFVTALAALGVGPYLIDGLPPLRTRPMADLHRALVGLGARFEYGERDGHLPATVSGGALRGGAIELPGDITSQYVTALMLIGPYLAEGVTIRLTSPLVSRPYLEITRSVMAAFGVDDVAIGDRQVRVGPGEYAPTDYRIEVDASSASYPLAAAAICGGSVSIEGLGAAPLQGDAAFVDLLGAMGCEVERSETRTTVRRTGALHGIEVDMADISDTVPTLAVVAPFADSPTRITGIGFIRRKESDRIGDVVRELQSCGVDAVEEPDGMVIRPSSLHGSAVGTHHDHRLAMAFALIGLRVPGIAIGDPEVVSKSWPGYWASIDLLSSPTQ